MSSTPTLMAGRCCRDGEEPVCVFPKSTHQYVFMEYCIPTHTVYTLMPSISVSDRKDYRPTWDLKQSEPIAGNYYPINSRAYIKVCLIGHTPLSATLSSFSHDHALSFPLPTYSSFFCGSLLVQNSDSPSCSLHSVLKMHVKFT